MQAYKLVQSVHCIRVQFIGLSVTRLKKRTVCGTCVYLKSFILENINDDYYYRRLSWKDVVLTVFCMFVSRVTENTRLSYCRGTARRAMKVEIAIVRNHD